MPIGAKSYQEALQMGTEIYHVLKKILSEYPEIKFVSLMGIDLYGNGTEEKIPIKIFLKKDDLWQKITCQGSSFYDIIPYRYNRDSYVKGMMCDGKGERERSKGKGTQTNELVARSEAKRKSE